MSQAKKTPKQKHLHHVKDRARQTLSAHQLNIIDNLYEAIIHNALDAFFITNSHGEILEVNDAFCRMDGYSRDELLSMKIQDLDIEFIDNPQKFIQINEKFVKDFIESNGRKNSIYIERKHKRKNGHIINVDVSYHYLGLDLNLFFHINRDITEQKKIHQQLKESEERYRALIELGGQLGEAVVMLQDTDKGEGIQTFVSNEWCHITGYSEEELLSMPFFDLLHPEYRKASLERHRRKMNGESMPGHFEMAIIRKDGVKVPIEVTSAYSMYKGKRANVAYIRDITKRKRLEEELKQYSEHLEGLVKKRTAALEEELRRRVSFTRALVHELKTPLTPVLGASEALVNQIKDTAYQGLARNIYIGACQLDKRIDELLDLARYEINMLKLDYQTVDPLQLLQDLSNYVAPQASRRNLILTLDLPSLLPQILADKERLRQVALNILDNSIKFTPDGGTIILRAMEKDKNLIIEVQDSGPGVPKELRQRIFSPYYKIESDRSRISGLGLGLALCKAIVELHGGQIWCKSTEGKGSTFGFSIPLSPKGAKPTKGKGVK
jgi:PAS domain S-box-containing protein